MKKYKFTFLALLSALIISMFAFTFTVFAAEDGTQRLVALNGTNVFYADVDGAVISATRETNEVDGEETVQDYAMFVIGEGQSVTYRKHLAYSWYSGEGADKFSLTLGFKNTDFEKYLIKFQSQQFNKTEDGVTTNYLIFVPDEEGTGVYAFFTQDEEEELVPEEGQVVYSAEDNARITISFGDFVNGDYTVNVTDGTNSGSGKFLNLSENYAKYVSSGTTATMPLTFSATFAEDAGEDAAAKMAIYQMNGQSFLLYNTDVDAEGNVTGGSINDNVAPVLCLNSNVNYLTYGESVDIDYTVIDVVASSPRSTVYYYVLGASQYAADDINYDNTDEGTDNYLFNEVSTTSTIRLLRDEDTFVPADLLEPIAGSDEQDNTDGYEVYGLIKIYVKLTDVTGTSGRSVNVLIDKYVSEDYKVNVYGSSLKNDESKTSYFIPIVDDSKGATYAAADDLTEADYKATVAAVSEDYQQKIDAVIAELEDGKIYAGSSNYLYLPDFTGYVSDNLGGYTDFKFSIYYKASSSGSHTSLAYNALAINVKEADVTYKFTVFVTDAAGNPMYYPTGDGSYEEITTSDVWDCVDEGLLPCFSFSVSYKPATVEDPGEQTLAYVGSTYSGVSFDITGISDTYSTSYKLYTFDRDAFYNDTGVDLTYKQFVESLEALFNNEYEGVENTRKYFTTIKPKSDLHEEDESYEDYIDYAWDDSAVTFVPQTTSEFCVVELTLKDTRSSQITRKYMGIRASETADSLSGENDWLKNNVASVVLLAIAGVSFIALIVLLVVKPKDKGDIDTIDLDGDKKKTRKKK